MAGNTKKKLERYKIIAELNESGLIDKEIAKLIGCSISSVSRARKHFDLKKVAPYKGFKSKISEKDLTWIKLNYLKVNDKQIGEKFGLSESAISKVRLKHGLLVKNQWARNQHPKGAEGLNHSNDVKQKISNSSKKSWANKDHLFNSKEHRQSLSNRQSQLMAKIHPSKIRSRGSAGYRKDFPNIYFRSTWEPNYARYLNLLKSRGELFKWQYEPDIFWFEAIKRGVRSYKPDFKIWDTEHSEPYYVEVKGYMDAKSKTKIKRMRIYYPKIKLKIFGLKQYKALKDLAPLIPNWEYCQTLKIGEKFIKP